MNHFDHKVGANAGLVQSICSHKCKNSLLSPGCIASHDCELARRNSHCRRGRLRRSSSTQRRHQQTRSNPRPRVQALRIALQKQGHNSTILHANGSMALLSFTRPIKATSAPWLTTLRTKPTACPSLAPTPMHGRISSAIDRLPPSVASCRVQLGDPAHDPSSAA